MFPALDLSGKVAVVIGGTSGIGRTLSLGLAEAGANVVATGRNAANVEEVAREIEAVGRRTLRVATDTRNTGSLQRLLATCLEQFDKVEILVNCAGKIKRAPTVDFPEKEWDDILETNLTGTLRACQVFGRHMLSRKWGRIINIASLNSYVAMHEVAAYAASKAGVAALTRALAVEWSRQGVLTNAIAPGIFRTPLNAELLNGTPRGSELLMRIPMGRLGETEELVGAAVFLASDSASYVTGQIFAVDGGFLASGVNQ